MCDPLSGRPQISLPVLLCVNVLGAPVPVTMATIMCMYVRCRLPVDALERDDLFVWRIVCAMR